MVLGDTPYIFKGGQEDLKRLFYSDPNACFSKAITIPAGYGVIKAGAVMGIITESTNRKGRYIPYNPVDDNSSFVAALNNVWGLAYLTDDPSTGSDGYVVMEESYKFVVGDHLAAFDSDNVQVDLTDITAIDRTTYSHIAKVTVSGTFSTELVSKGAAIGIQTNTATPFVEAKGILMFTVDTGLGENAKGGNGVMVLGNAMLYKDNLYNYKSTDVLADRSSWREEDPYLII